MRKYQLTRRKRKSLLQHRSHNHTNKKGGLFRNPFSVLAKFKQAISQSDFGPCLTEMQSDDSGEEQQPLNVNVPLSKHKKIVDCSDIFFAHIEKPNNDALIKLYNGFSEGDKTKLTQEIDTSIKKIFYKLIIGFIEQYNDFKKKIHKIEQLEFDPSDTRTWFNPEFSNVYDELLDHIRREISVKDNLDTLHVLHMKGDAMMKMEPDLALQTFEDLKKRKKIRDNITDDTDDDLYDNDNLLIDEKIAYAKSVEYYDTQVSKRNEEALKMYQQILAKRYEHDKFMRSSMQSTGINMKEIKRNIQRITSIIVQIIDKELVDNRELIPYLEKYIEFYQSLYFQVEPPITEIYEELKAVLNSLKPETYSASYPQIPAAGGRRRLLRKLIRKAKNKFIVVFLLPAHFVFC
jgi:hypothetical protein